MSQIATPALLRTLPLFTFKGSRNYLHGTDIFLACMQVLSREYPSSDIKGIDITFHGLAKAALVMYSTAPPGIEAKVHFSCLIDGAHNRCALVESNREIAERTDYPEEQIVAATYIDVETATATSSRSLPFTNIERWVAMVKALHCSLYRGLSGKWFFVRGRFDEYQEHYGIDVQHKVILQANFNNKLTRTELLVDGQRVGDIFFALE